MVHSYRILQVYYAIYAVSLLGPVAYPSPSSYSFHLLAQAVDHLVCIIHWLNSATTRIIDPTLVGVVLRNASYSISGAIDRFTPFDPQKRSKWTEGMQLHC
jgi:hypothetical protein